MFISFLLHGKVLISLLVAKEIRRNPKKKRVNFCMLNKASPLIITHNNIFFLFVIFLKRNLQNIKAAKHLIQEDEKCFGEKKTSV